MPNFPNLSASAGADYVSDATGSAPGVVFKSSATEGLPLGTAKNVLSSPTVALIQLALGSTASAPIFDITGQGFVSCTTILFTTGATSGVGALRVKNGDTYFWIPLMPVGSVTAAAR